MSRASASDRVFGTVVAQARVRQQLSQAALGRAAGFSHAQARLSSIETGGSPATISEALALAAALGIPLGELVDGGVTAVECPRCAKTADALAGILDGLPDSARTHPCS